MTGADVPQVPDPQVEDEDPGTPVQLSSGEVISGANPIVIIGPNGSGKTRLSRTIVSTREPRVPEVINALRSTKITPQSPALSQSQARQNINAQQNNARNTPWELSSDFDFVLAQLLAEDGDSARGYRKAHKTGQLETATIEPTALERTEELWGEVFPGRTLSREDLSPVVTNQVSGQGVKYTASQMSDGERAALYLMGKVLSAQPNSVLVVDEPETHFHSLLAVRLWDALQQVRVDLRFVYVTHDLIFALSREPAHYLLADPFTNLLTPLSVDQGLPTDVRREILGAASFSYYASRVVFCEGTDSSLDQAFWSSWFFGRDTIVVPVGSCEDVVDCVKAFNASHLVDNLDAIGIIDRDFHGVDVLFGLDDAVWTLPVHEVEALICVAAVVERLAAHLGRTLTKPVADLIQEAISDAAVARAAHERSQLKVLNAVEDIICTKPADWTEEGLESHAGALRVRLGASPDPAAVFSEELETVKQVVAARDAMRMLEVFPSKELSGKVAAALGQKRDALFQLVCVALAARGPDDPLLALGNDLALIYTGLGFPDRQVGERPAEATTTESVRA